jgi:hypothetical protein
MPMWLREDFHTIGTLSEVLDEALKVSRQLEEHTAIFMMGGTRTNRIQVRGQLHVRQ